jgi:hypothetical protein
MKDFFPTERFNAFFFLETMQLLVEEKQIPPVLQHTG